MSVLYKRVELIQTVTLLFRQTVFLAVEVQKNYRRGGIVTGDNHSVSLANITVHYVLQPIADILEQTEVFRRFIDDVVWITDSESTNIGIRSALKIQYLRIMA